MLRKAPLACPKIIAGLSLRAFERSLTSTGLVRFEVFGIPAQNHKFMGRFSATSRRKGNQIIKIYGAGDGNRTHVRSLGSFYTAIVRRPL